MTTQSKVTVIKTGCSTEISKISESRKNGGKLKFNVSKKNF